MDPFPAPSAMQMHKAVPAHVSQAGVGREGTCTERAIP